ncbi:MAG: apolipoprotein N-acyltransferase, partial [Pseudomonadales bacterium]|nr:apolipoprotein N-acyltransferase [Pseudomonadales bacterium]
MREKLNFLADRRWPGDLLALLSGASFPFGFAPFDYWPIGIVSIITFLLSLANASNRRGVWRFYLFAVGMYGIGASWIYVSIHRDGGASAMLATALVAGFVLWLSLISVLHGILYMRFVRPLPQGLLLGFPLMWVLQEWFRTWFLTGFPWLFAGYGHLGTPLAGWGPVLGVMGMSLGVVMTATVIYLMVRERTRRSTVTGMLTLALVWGGGFVLTRVDFVESTGETISVSAVQGNVDQATKWQRSMVQPILRLYADLTSQEWGRDLVVWPGAAVTVFKE